MYSPNVKPERKMKLEDFVKNLRGKQTLATVIIKVSSCNFHWKNNIFLWGEKKKKAKCRRLVSDFTWLLKPPSLLLYFWNTGNKTKQYFVIFILYFLSRCLVRPFYSQFFQCSWRVTMCLKFLDNSWNLPHLDPSQSQRTTHKDCSFCAREWKWMNSFCKKDSLQRMCVRIYIYINLHVVPLCCRLYLREGM